MPLGAVALTGLTVIMITGILEPAVALSGFAEPAIWLIVAAFFISVAFTKTGRGRRIALVFVPALGRRSLGLAYGAALTDPVLAPAAPGNTAHVAAMYGAFLAAAAAAGAPPVMSALVLGFIGSLYGGLTHYASGPAPVLFGGGYVTLAEWWRLGAIVAVANVAVWMAAGPRGSRCWAPGERVGAGRAGTGCRMSAGRDAGRGPRRAPAGGRIIRPGRPAPRRRRSSPPSPARCPARAR
ncbi:SLC13 family permease [Planobispora siamensis]|uniref:Uncharacterized protein n=1 Tax=Planobispora siamensis TaxID=936338 RepID=A0A8J3SHK5_9ACTN|nr:SLC13 family permease [Planobispora siamensis]GIH94661.1 hypothetical protein Psi01_52910 [Planobispora siamensis]